jgi:hypothetical protein
VNSFYEHAGFDRILLNGLIQPKTGRPFNTYCYLYTLRDKRAVVTNSCENPRASALRLLHQ